VAAVQLHMPPLSAVLKLFYSYLLKTGMGCS